jgi:hypothetical protein
MPFRISATSSGSNVDPSHKACLISVASQSSATRELTASEEGARDWINGVCAFTSDQDRLFASIQILAVLSTYCISRNCIFTTGHDQISHRTNVIL